MPTKLQEDTTECMHQKINFIFLSDFSFNSIVSVLWVLEGQIQTQGEDHVLCQGEPILGCHFRKIVISLPDLHYQALYEGGTQMKSLIPMDKYGVFADTCGIARVDSRFVAEFFGKEHLDVRRDIQRILSPESGLSENFRQFNYTVSTYFNNQNRPFPRFMMPPDGFTMLVMGYAGKKAKHTKELYNRQFRKMEQFISTVNRARAQFPKLTKQIRLLYPDAKPNFYSNECDMIHRIVLGMTAEQYHSLHRLEEDESIYAHLCRGQMAMLDILQSIDMGLLMTVSDYQQRKRHLEWYAIINAKSFGASCESVAQLAQEGEGDQE